MQEFSSSTFRPTHPLPEVIADGYALITGGSSGLGLEFARQLASQRINLVLVARGEQRLREAARDIESEFSVKVETISADLADHAALEPIKERLLATENPVTILVNNAGAGLYSSMITTDFSQIRSAAEVMGLAPMELGGVAASAMSERHRGLIINVASVSALVPMGAYSAIKALVRTWSDSLAVKLAGSGVHVVTCMPGWVRTEFHARTGVSNDSLPSWVWLTPDRVVAETLDGAARGKMSVTPSKRFKVISFLAVHAPGAAVRKAVVKLNKGRR